jgi:hypothetical protein
MRQDVSTRPLQNQLPASAVWRSAIPDRRDKMNLFSQKSAVERAFELARTGDFRDLEQLKKQLGREGLQPEQVYGPVLRQQLRKVMAEATTSGDTRR